MSNGATHWCYACRRPIRLRGQDIICPNCDDGAVQEIGEMVGALNTYGVFGPRFDDRLDRRFGMMEAMPSALVRQRMAEMGSNPVFDPNAAGETTAQVLVRQPSVGPRLISGSNMPAHMSGGGRRSADRPNFSGFLVSPRHEALFERLLLLQTSNHQGPPPAPQSAINSMPVVTMYRRHLNDDPHCAVCTDKFEADSEAMEMPCKHLYHTNCIVPWLVQHNSCPVCRHPLPPQRGSDSDGASRSASVHADEAPGRVVAGADLGPVVRNDDSGSNNSLSFLCSLGASSPSRSSSYQYGGAAGEPAVFDDDPCQINYSEWHYDP